MPKLKYTLEARQDLADIQAYIYRQSGSARIAKEFRDNLRRRCAKLASFSQVMGRARPELAEGLRSVAEGNYLIFIRYIDETLEVVAISEASRDFPNLFGDRDDE